MPDLKSEVLVIGSGPGGATTAHLLAEHGKDVLLLEEGADFQDDTILPFSLDEMAQKYRAGGLNPMMGKPKIAFVEGCCLGGGSEINSALYHRTPEDILEHWHKAFAVRDTTQRDLGPHFQYCEQALGISVYPAAAPLASRKLDEGAKKLGWRCMEIPRAFKYDGAPKAEGAPRGTRQSMSKTFLPRAFRTGTQLMHLTRAHRLRRSGNGWLVLAKRKNQRVEIQAENVFLCCGAVQTPLLLRRSGITKNIGRSLAIHPTVKAVAVFDEQINHAHLGVGVHQVKEFSPRLTLGCSISSPSYLAAALADYPSAETQIWNRWRHMAVYYAMITGPNVGRICPIFKQPDPWIQYRLSAGDLSDLATGLQRLCTLLIAAGAGKVYPCIAGAKPIRGPEDLAAMTSVLHPQSSNITTIHLFSSCPMGEDETRCAANSMGQIHGVANLVVNDASLVCTAPGVNPQGTIMALARRNTLHFLGQI